MAKKTNVSIPNAKLARKVAETKDDRILEEDVLHSTLYISFSTHD